VKLVALMYTILQHDTPRPQRTTQHVPTVLSANLPVFTQFLTIRIRQLEFLMALGRFVKSEGLVRE